METFSSLLAICAGNSSVTGEFPARRPVTRWFDDLFDLCLNIRLSKQWRSWWFETPSHPLWRHCDVQTSMWLVCACRLLHSLKWKYLLKENTLVCRRPLFQVMMTSSNGNIFRVTGLLCGEFTCHRWIPRTKASDAELWCFLWSMYATQIRCATWFSIVVRRSTYRANGIPHVTKLC